MGTLDDIQIATGLGIVLGIDTCGPTGSVASGQLRGKSLEILRQIELEGRNYSTTLIAAIGDLLAEAAIRVADLRGIVAVNGPGSFTGVRIGLSAVKGLAEASGIPVVAVSRLEVLARKAGVDSAALDAHRQEVYLRLGGLEPAKELLAGAEEFARLGSDARSVAVCDEAAAQTVSRFWPAARLVIAAAPTAADALRLFGATLANGPFANLELLDGHYLRRSDAEIFGDSNAPRAAEAR